MMGHSTLYGVKLSAKDVIQSEVLLGTSWRHIENLGSMFENTYRNSQKSNIPSSPPSFSSRCMHFYKNAYSPYPYIGSSLSKILCSNPTTPIHSHFLMGGVNKPPRTSSDQLGDKQFELEGSIFFLHFQMDPFIYRCLESLHVSGENSLKITYKTCSKLCTLRHLQ